jgi:hypothetical protein
MFFAKHVIGLQTFRKQNLHMIVLSLTKCSGLSSNKHNELAMGHVNFVRLAQ